MPTWAGSYDDMLRQRRVRLAVEYDRTLYFSNAGRPYGLAIEIARDLSKWLSSRHADKLQHQSLNVQIVPVPKGDTLLALSNDQADIALGQFHIEHLENAPTDLIIKSSAILLKEILVTGKDDRFTHQISSLDGLEVRAAYPESFYSGLKHWNNHLLAEGKSPIKLLTWPQGLEDEDMLQMVNAGLINAIFISDWKAVLWQSVLPNIMVHRDITFQNAGTIGWALNKSNADLAIDIESFVQEWVANDGMRSFRTDSFKSKLRALKNPTNEPDWSRFEKLWPIFEKYGKQFNLDPFMLAALGYQETGLIPVQTGMGGAVGVMQLMPSTGSSMGVGDIHQVDANIHAAAKLMDVMLKQYFSDADFTTQNRTLFAIASYNAGPNAIAGLRKFAKNQGFNPDAWLGNVEIVAAEKLGVNVMTYVRNVFKYFVIYSYAMNDLSRNK